MKIAIDISSVVYGTGVSTYTEELVRHLLEIDKENQYVLCGGSLRRKGDIKRFFHTLKGSTFQGRAYNIPPSLADLVWNRLHIFPIEKLIGEIDVFHSSDWTQPPSKAFKVTTIHDLAHVKFPDLVHPKIRAVQSRRLKWVKSEVDRIIVPSMTTKNDLVELGYDDNKIVVVHEGVDGAIRKIDQKDIARIKNRHGIKGKYLLSVGINPRKNTKRIIEAFNKLQKSGDYKGLSLVFVGNAVGVDIKDVDGVYATGHVSDEDFPAFYAGAEVLVYPSLYEGFGIPILDAFAMKLPVVTSNLGSMKEIADDAAVLVNPDSAESISKGVRKAIVNRDVLIANGTKRVKQFSWEKAARETLDVYKMKQ